MHLIQTLNLIEMKKIGNFVRRRFWLAPNVIYTDKVIYSMKFMLVCHNISQQRKRNVYNIFQFFWTKNRKIHFLDRNKIFSSRASELCKMRKPSPVGRSHIKNFSFVVFFYNYNTRSYYKETRTSFDIILYINEKAHTP